MNIPGRVVAAFAISIFTLSQAAILVRAAETPPEILGFWRLLFALALSYGLVLWQKQSVWTPFVKSEFKSIIWAGLLFFLHFWIWFYSVEMTTIANSTLLFCMNPLFVAVAAVSTKREKLTWPLLIALIFGLLGLLIMEWEALSFKSLFGGGGPTRAIWGDLLALISSICFAGYILAAKRLRSGGSNYVLTFWFNLVCVVGFGLTVPFSSHSLTAYPLKSWLLFLALAVFPSIFGHMFFTYSLRFMNASVASCFVLLEPVLAAITAGFFFSETVSGRTMIGFVVITAGLLNLFVRSMKKQMV